MTRRIFLSLTPPLIAAVDRGKFAQAENLLEGLVRDKKLRAASMLVRRRESGYEKAFGRATPDAMFLIASITKPMTAAGVMRLADLGKLSLEDPASRYLPGFRTGDRARITIRQLLAHTSGLPDMLPENAELRKRHAPLSEFVARTLLTPLLFEPGTRVSYQSMGILLAAEIAQRIDGRPFPKFLEEEIFKPLGMPRTALGLGRFQLADTVRCQTEHADPDLGGTADAASWDWNSSYWRNLGAPWGGAHSTSRDIARFLRSFLQPTGKPLKERTCAAMIRDQNTGLNRPWGIGWALGSGFGKACSSRTFGHAGSTGTLCWADPTKDLIFVLLTSLPERVSRKPLIDPVSDLVSEST